MSEEAPAILDERRIEMRLSMLILGPDKNPARPLRSTVYIDLPAAFDGAIAQKMVQFRAMSFMLKQTGQHRICIVAVTGCFMNLNTFEGRDFVLLRIAVGDAGFSDCKQWPS